MLPMSGFGNGGEARQGYGGKGGGGPPGMAQRGGGMMDGRYEDGFPQNVPHGDMRHEAYKMMEFVNHKMQQRQVTLDNMAMQLRYLQKAREDDAREANTQIMQLRDSVMRLTALVDKAQGAPTTSQPTSGVPTPTAAGGGGGGGGASSAPASLPLPSSLPMQSEPVATSAAQDTWGGLLGMGQTDPAPTQTQEPANALSYCHNCMKTPRENALLLCGGCRKAAFCDRQCQMDAWGKHRLVCNSSA